MKPLRIIKAPENFGDILPGIELAIISEVGGWDRWGEYLDYTVRVNYDGKPDVIWELCEERKVRVYANPEDARRKEFFENVTCEKCPNFINKYWCQELGDYRQKDSKACDKFAEAEWRRSNS